MKAYYFRHAKGYLLAPVYASNELEARIELPKQHTWCEANESNTRLEKVEEGTEWERICAQPVN